MKTITLPFLDFMMTCWKPQKKKNSSWPVHHLMKRNIKMTLAYKHCGGRKVTLPMSVQVSGRHLNCTVSGEDIPEKEPKPYCLQKHMRKFRQGWYPIRSLIKLPGCCWSIWKE